MDGTLVTTMIVALALALVSASPAFAQDVQAPRILFLSKSEGFEHGPVAQKAGAPSVAEKVLKQLAEDNGATSFESTKDASKINAANLKNYDLLIFYTQGDLSKPGKDGAPGIGPDGQAELVEWVKNGGRLMGFHSASDTFHTPAGGEITPYLKMLGAEFAGHWRQFAGAVKIVDAAHPAVAGFPVDYKPMEEWYTFKDFNTGAVRVLALMDPGEERVKQKEYNIPAYPVIWVAACGKGKVYFSALGHREDMWEKDTVFQRSIVDAGMWLMTGDLTGTEPNYDKVVPKDVPKEAPKK